MRLDKLERIVAEAYRGQDTTVLDSTDRKVLIRLEQEHKTEWCIASIDDINETVYNGKYFTPFQVLEMEEVKGKAWKAWKEITRG